MEKTRQEELYLRRKSRAVVLDPTRKSIKPLMTKALQDRRDKRDQAACAAQNTLYRIIHDALGSPGCTRAVMTAKVLTSTGEESAEGEGRPQGGAGSSTPVMVTRSQGIRQGDRHRLDICTCSLA